MFSKILMIWTILTISTGILKPGESSDQLFVNRRLSYSPLFDRDTLVSLINRCFQNGSLEAINDTSCNGLFYSYLCSKHTERQCQIFIIGVDPTGNPPLECNDYFYGLHLSVAEDHEPTYCMDETREMRRHPWKIIAHIVGYSVSVVALITALMFFFCIRTLHSTLGRIQMQVYIAVLINNTLWIMWYITLFYDIRFITGNKILCKVIHVAVNYFLATSYFWLLALCLYLYELVNTIVLGHMWSFLRYGLLGWGGPCVVVSSYIASRYFLENTDGCWLLQVNSSLILAMPNTIVVISSFAIVSCLLGNIIVDILEGTNETTKLASLKAAHAALFQLLLLGILMLLLPLRPNSELNEENVIWDIVWILLQNSQGVWFAAFLSSSNVEVRALIKKYLPVFRPRPGNNMEMAETSQRNQGNQSNQSTQSRPSKQQLNL